VSDWIRVCSTAECLPGEHRIVFVDGVEIAVINLDGAFYAIEDVCTHDGGELMGGRIIGREIECPRHGARFDIPTGVVTCPPAYSSIASFPVKVEDGAVYTRDDRWD
jgi:3-phenylpropionate/trans-cinnamate dioxygenase ferredoxin subunit